MPHYNSERFWKIYEKLPQELKDALSSEETNDYIYDICKDNDALEKLEEIADYVGQVLTGSLPPEGFQDALEKELKIKKEAAKKIAHEINRFIFFPVKKDLAAMHRIDLAEEFDEPLAKTSPIKPRRTASEPELKPETRAPELEKEEDADLYREPVE